MKTLLQITGGLLSASLLTAAISSSDLARLGQDLTPLGAEKAGNADGSIPAWDGGITSPPAGYKVGDHHPDPFAGESPIITITASNMAAYRDQLTAGAVALLETYPDTYSIPVYPSHRTIQTPLQTPTKTKILWNLLIQIL